MTCVDLFSWRGNRKPHFPVLLYFCWGSCIDTIPYRQKQHFTFKEADHVIVPCIWMEGCEMRMTRYQEIPLRWWLVIAGASHQTSSFQTCSWCPNGAWTTGKSRCQGCGILFWRYLTGNSYSWNQTYCMQQLPFLGNFNIDDRLADHLQSRTPTCLLFVLNATAEAVTQQQSCMEG